MSGNEESVHSSACEDPKLMEEDALPPVPPIDMAMHRRRAVLNLPATNRECLLAPVNLAQAHGVLDRKASAAICYCRVRQPRHPGLADLGSRPRCDRLPSNPPDTTTGHCPMSGCRFTAIVAIGLFVTHGQKNVRICPSDVREHRIRDAILAATR
eukprot:scaffold78189_cov53-Attheya_sp.AAC.1